MLPMCKKLETFHPGDAKFDKSKHGYEGPVSVGDGGYRGKVSEAQFMDTVKGMGYKEIDDLQDLEANGGFAVCFLSFSSSVI